VEMAQRWTISPAETASLERISTELARIGLALPGSVAVRSYRCGKPNCACHAETSRLHGPYNQWSRRAANKTVHVNLSPTASTTTSSSLTTTNTSMR